MDHLKQIIARVLQVSPDSVNDETSSQTLPQWDSMGHMNVIMALETEFRVRFTVHEILEMRDIPAVKRVLLGRQAA
jgi:acyl carrier protein